MDRAALRAEARAFFGLDPDAPTVFVTGGSQGAQRLNEGFAGAAADLQAAGIQVLHAIGPKNTLEVEQTGPLPYRVLSYVDRMELRLRRRRPGGLPCGLEHGDRGVRCRTAGDLRSVAAR